MWLEDIFGSDIFSILLIFSTIIFILCIFDFYRFNKRRHLVRAIITVILNVLLIIWLLFITFIGHLSV